jgi:hypothetical protein
MNKVITDLTDPFPLSLALQPNVVTVGWQDQSTLDYVMFGLTKKPKVVRVQF